MGQQRGPNLGERQLAAGGKRQGVRNIIAPGALPRPQPLPAMSGKRVAAKRTGALASIAATAIAPRAASGMPITAARRIWGNSISAASMASGRIFSALLLMIRLTRPVRCRYPPASRKPISPTLNQPLIGAAPTYREHSIGPDEKISPSTPGGAGKPPASRISIPTPGNGLPTDPSGAGAGWNER